MPRRKAQKNLLPLQPGDVPDTFADISDLRGTSAIGRRRRSRSASSASSLVSRLLRRLKTLCVGGPKNAMTGRSADIGYGLLVVCASE